MFSFYLSDLFFICFFHLIMSFSNLHLFFPSLCICSAFCVLFILQDPRFNRHKRVSRRSFTCLFTVLKFCGEKPLPQFAMEFVSLVSHEVGIREGYFYHLLWQLWFSFIYLFVSLFWIYKCEVGGDPLPPPPPQQCAGFVDNVMRSVNMTRSRERETYREGEREKQRPTDRGGRR